MSTRPASIALFLIAILLSLPVLLMPAPDRLEAAQKRAVASLPSAEMFAVSPRQYFSSLIDYFEDNNWLALHAANVRQKAFMAIGGTGTDQVVRDGEFYFITRHGPQFEPFSAINGSCRSGDAAANHVSNLIESYTYIRSVLETKDIALRVLVVPSKPVLYPERLKGLVPSSIAASCREAFNGGGAARALAQAFPTEYDNVGVSYPLEIFKAERNNPHFYPPSNFHVRGKSAFMAAQTIVPAVIAPSEDPLLEVGEADMTFILGERRVPIWNYDYGAFEIDDNLNRMVARTWTPFQFTNLFRATRANNSLTDRTGVILADSFGNFMFDHLAPYYRELSLLSANGAKEEDFLRGLLWVQSDKSPPSEVIIVVHDGGVNLINVLANDLRAGQAEHWDHLR